MFLSLIVRREVLCTRTLGKKFIQMKQVKITVLKTTLDKELAAEYGVEGLTACPMMREGQVFYADYAKPDGLCDEAWKAIYQYVFALAHGAGKDALDPHCGTRSAPGVSGLLKRSARPSCEDGRAYCDT